MIFILVDIFDTDKLKELYSNIESEELESNDLIFLLADLKLAVKEKHNVGVIYGKCGEGYICGCLENVFVKFFKYRNCCNSIYFKFKNRDQLFEMTNCNKIELQKSKPIKYYIKDFDLIKYTIILN